MLAYSWVGESSSVTPITSTDVEIRVEECVDKWQCTTTFIWIFSLFVLQLVHSTVNLLI